MIKRLLLTAGVAIVFASPALAFHCPADIKAIDNGLPKANLSQSQKAEVMSLRNQGEAEHKAGKHKDSVDSLAKAMRIILNNQ